MGGYGSGRWRNETTRTTVEDCLFLSVDKLTSDRMIRPNVQGSGILTWTRTSTGEVISRAGYEVDTVHGSWLRLRYTRTAANDDVDYRIPLTSTPTPWNALRWWFICPLSVDGRHCGRRVGKLYLPPNGRFYGCRHCYRLTYTSCNESRKFDRLFRSLGRERGFGPAEVRRLLKRQF